MATKRATPRRPERPCDDPPKEHLTASEMALLERLVDRGALITVPALKSQKPRKVTAASLTDHGTRVLLFLSAKTME